MNIGLDMLISIGYSALHKTQFLNDQFWLAEVMAFN